MKFRLATSADIDAVVTLYDEAKKQPFCVWNESYPLRADAVSDLDAENLYVLSEGDIVIGALSVVSENETDDLPCWQIMGEGVREIARVVIAPHHHGHGYARLMVQKMCEILRSRGDRAVHISVSVENVPAMRTYPSVGFRVVGEADLFGGHYVLMEKTLTDATP